MKFIFIRHGKDSKDYRGGWSNQDINEEGKKEAIQLANYLKNSNFKINKIISSDLKRAVSTAKIINGCLNLPIEYDVNMREIDNGDLSGMLNSMALIKYPGIFFNTLEMDEKYPNGESPIEFYNRIETWFNRTLETYKNQDGNIIFITHSGVINIIYYIVKKRKWSNKEKSYPINNCSIHILDLDNMQFELENYYEYLKIV